MTAIASVQQVIVALNKGAAGREGSGIVIHAIAVMLFLLAAVLFFVAFVFGFAGAVGFAVYLVLKGLGSVIDRHERRFIQRLGERLDDEVRR